MVEFIYNLIFNYIFYFIPESNDIKDVYLLIVSIYLYHYIYERHTMGSLLIMLVMIMYIMMLSENLAIIIQSIMMTIGLSKELSILIIVIMWIIILALLMGLSLWRKFGKYFVQRVPPFVFLTILFVLTVLDWKYHWLNWKLFTYG